MLNRQRNGTDYLIFRPTVTTARTRRTSSPPDGSSQRHADPHSTPPPWLPRSTRRQWPPLSNTLPPVIVFSRHSAASPCRRTAVLRCHRTAAWQCRRMEVLQCLHTAALPCRRVNFRPVLGAVPLHSPPLRIKIHTGTSTFFIKYF